jgi:hypothetical protein
VKNKLVKDLIFSNVSEIKKNTFYNYALSSITFTSNITTIKDNAFRGMPNLIFCNFSSNTTVPVIYTDSFYGMSDSLKIIVPDTLYDEWIAATNWSALADHIIKKSDWDASQVTE